jgi:hypothetical protein
MIKSKLFRFKRVPANDNDSNNSKLVVKSTKGAKEATKILKELEYKSHKIAIILNALKLNQSVVLPLPDCVDKLGEELAWDLILDLKRKKLICRDADGVLRVSLNLAFHCAGRTDKEITNWLSKWV